MKHSSFFALLVCFIALSNAAPIPGLTREGDVAGGSKYKRDGWEMAPVPVPPVSPWSYAPPPAYYGNNYMPEYVAQPEYRRPEPLAFVPEHHDHWGQPYIPVVPHTESHVGGGMTRQILSETGTHRTKGQLGANPGSATPGPHPRIAHKAPARLQNTQNHRPGSTNAQTNTATNSKRPSGMTLPLHKGVVARPNTANKEPKLTKGHTNPIPGRASAPGHLSRPKVQSVPHRGAPVPILGAHTSSQQYQAHSASHAAHAPIHGAPHAEGPQRLQHIPGSHNDAHNLAPHHSATLNSHKGTVPRHPAPHAPAHSPHHADGRSGHTPGPHSGAHAPASHHTAPSMSHNGAVSRHPGSGAAAHGAHHAQGSQHPQHIPAAHQDAHHVAKTHVPHRNAPSTDHKGTSPGHSAKNAPAHGAHHVDSHARPQHTPAAHHSAHTPATHQKTSTNSHHTTQKHSSGSHYDAHHDVHKAAPHHSTPSASHWGTPSRRPASHAPAHAADHSKSPAHVQHTSGPHHDVHPSMPQHGAPSTSHKTVPSQHAAPQQKGSSSGRSKAGKKSGKK